MLQSKHRVNVNAVYDFNTGELVGGYMDDFTLVDYVGKHIVSVEAWMDGEDWRASVMCPKESVWGMSDLDLLHQEALSKLLGYDSLDYELELEYGKLY